MMNGFIEGGGLKGWGGVGGGEERVRIGSDSIIDFLVVIIYYLLLTFLHVGVF